MWNGPKNLQAGQWLQDCDPRYSKRKVMIHTVVQHDTMQDYIIYYNGKHNFKIRIDRIHAADYTGKKGWKLTDAPGIQTSQ